MPGFYFVPREGKDFSFPHLTSNTPFTIRSSPAMYYSARIGVNWHWFIFRHDREDGDGPVWERTYNTDGQIVRGDGSIVDPKSAIPRYVFLVEDDNEQMYYLDMDLEGFNLLSANINDIAESNLVCTSENGWRFKKKEYDALVAGLKFVGNQHDMGSSPDSWHPIARVVPIIDAPYQHVSLIEGDDWYQQYLSELEVLTPDNIEDFQERAANYTNGYAYSPENVKRAREKILKVLPNSREDSGPFYDPEHVGLRCCEGLISLGNKALGHE